MEKRRQLKVVGTRDGKLGRATIMDRALAQRYGAPYVHLAAFAIDVDRVHQQVGDDLPFAWEVYLTEVQLERFLDGARHDPSQLIEDMCLAILELPRPRGNDPGALGAQLAFAIYTAVARGLLPPRIGHCFGVWRKPPVDLIDEVSALAAQPGLAAKLARRCLDTTLDPPLVQPAREALLAIAES